MVLAWHRGHFWGLSHLDVEQEVNPSSSSMILTRMHVQCWILSGQTFPLSLWNPQAWSHWICLRILFDLVLVIRWGTGIWDLWGRLVFF